jgi:apolipoprotein N-acyltransferase
MNSRLGQIVFRILSAVAVGAIMRWAVGLRPDWWAVWLAPALLLIIAIRFPGRDARWMVLLAAVIANSTNFHYFRLVMPLPAVIASIAGQTLLWVFLVFASQRVVRRYRAWWTVFVYPVLWVAVDTLEAALLPDGNWGSLAYSQGDRLTVLQVASLFGTAGVLFLLALVPSAVALAIEFGASLRRGWIAYGLTALLLASSLIFGYLRLRQPVRGVETTFGIVSIDDPIGLRALASYATNIFDGYDRMIATLASQGAQVIVLPEKIAMLSPSSALDRQHDFSVVASANHVWLEVGVGIYDGKTPTNWEWLFAPDGSLAAIYEKHHMAPPERRAHYTSGTDYAVHTIDGQSYGLAICKDMHFAALGRAYGQRHVSVMLVPAWDFDYLDGWMETRTTILRGIENGYSIVRASREGLLTASDPYGRVLAETTSSTMPGRSLLAKVVVANPVPTLYTRIGNILGWMCVISAVVFLSIGRRKTSPKAA